MYKLYSNELKMYVEIVYSVVLAISCVYTYFKAPVVICLISTCVSEAVTDIVSMFSRSIALVCLISRITVLYKNNSDFPIYKKKIEYYEQYYPTDLSKKKLQRLFIVCTSLTYIIIILPINVYRIYLIYYNIRIMILVLFYTIMYLQNISICWTEICYVTHCFDLYLKFQTINDEMADFKSETIIANKFPVVLQTKGRSDRFTDPGSIDGFLSADSSAHNLANSIELLRMRHQFVRGSFVELSNLYSIQIGLSVCVLFVMALFDIYAAVTAEDQITKTHLLLYGWLLQYWYRFCVIVLTTHVTTKQANKPKVFITDINNRYIDNSSKEELQLFLNQLSGGSVEFSPCDFFTLNTHLITSAIIAGTTYLIMLLHISNDK